jgi:GH24 family phage-related lysozyme (muramidase)
MSPWGDHLVKEFEGVSVLTPSDSHGLVICTGEWTHPCTLGATKGTRA